MSQHHLRGRRILWAVLLALCAAGITVGAGLAQAKQYPFDLVRSSSAEAANCLSTASGHATVTEVGLVEMLDLAVSNLAPNTTYSVFVIQVPDKPFGIGWYNGEIQTDAYGSGKQTFIGRFNTETFAIAPGAAPAPVVHPNPPNPDATTNPAFGPVHTFHLGVWFSDPADAAKAGCTNAVTPFDGDHVAGIQMLSTRNFPVDAGPLKQVVP
ncbi:MAG TPA: hypothetical protein VGJ97_13065 [Anaerolineaceae bacterium]|jgi:hypothetical protein